VVYSQRVKDQVAKQLLKNKELLAGVVADIPAEGYSKEAIHIMNFAPVVGLSWGGDDKRMLNYVGLIPPFSKSQVVYSQRVKDQVAKQLLKNKELLAGVVADIPAEGYSKEVIHIMNFAPVVGLSWGGDDKRMLNLLSGIEKEKRELAAPKVKGKRELKNLECSLKNIEASGRRSSQAKCQRRRVFSGLKTHFPSPLRCSRRFGVVLGVFFGFSFWVWMGCFPGWVFVSRVCFLGATYQPYTHLYLTHPFGFFDIQHYLSKKNSS
jgi:hypothetical protein